MLGYRAYEVQNREKDIKLAQVSLIIVFGKFDKPSKLNIHRDC